MPRAYSMITLKIGVISDTHGLFRPEAEKRLAGVDHIIHGGDIGRPDVLVALRRIAPVTAIRGNVDTGDWAGNYADTELVRLAGRSIYVLRTLPQSGDRNRKRDTLPKPGKCGAAALQAFDHACHARYLARRTPPDHS